MTMKHRARASRDLTFPYALLQMFYWMNMAVTAGYARTLRLDSCWQREDSCLP